MSSVFPLRSPRLCGEIVVWRPLAPHALVAVVDFLVPLVVGVPGEVEPAAPVVEGWGLVEGGARAEAGEEGLRRTPLVALAGHVEETVVTVLPRAGIAAVYDVGYPRIVYRQCVLEGVAGVADDTDWAGGPPSSRLPFAVIDVVLAGVGARLALLVGPHEPDTARRVRRE